MPRAPGKSFLIGQILAIRANVFWRILMSQGKFGLLPSFYPISYLPFLQFSSAPTLKCSDILNLLVTFAYKKVLLFMQNMRKLNIIELNCHLPFVGVLVKWATRLKSSHHGHHFLSNSRRLPGGGGV